MRIRPLAGLSERGFSFDLVSRKKTARAEEAPEAGAEHEAPTGNPTLQLTDPILDDPDLMVEPFETVLQQLRGTVEAERQDAADNEVMAAAKAAVATPQETDMADELSEDLDPEPEPEPEPAPMPIRAAAPVTNLESMREPIAEILRLMPENAVKPTPVATPEPAPTPAPVIAAVPLPRSETPQPEAAATPRRGSRVKTTFLGFERSDGRIEDVFLREAEAKTNTGRTEFPFGWVVIIKGPGRGNAIAIGAGVSQIGRGDDQAIQLDFGDNSISRENHAAIAFDPEDRKFYLGHGGKANIVRLNGKPVLSTEPLSDGDLIRIGETTMTFVAFCGEDFIWENEQ